MRKKFLCGRLVKTASGAVKRLELIYGGGTRDCTLSHIDMGFDEIHDKIRELFKLNQPDCKTELYDFQCQKLDTIRYPTFVEYILKNGLKFRGTLLYLCTEEENEESINLPSPEKAKKTGTTKQNSTPVGNRRVDQVEADSSTPLIKIEDIPYLNRSTNNEIVHNNMLESLHTNSSTPFSNYSFEKALNELVDYLRHLVNQYNHENIFLQLFEQMCMIRGLSSINLDRLKEYVPSINENQKQIYKDILDNIDRSLRSFKTLLELNKIKISHIDQNSLIMNSFNLFHQKFQTLYNQVMNNVRNNGQSLPNRSTSDSINPKPSNNYSSSCRSHSERKSRKNTRPTSLSPQRSSTQNRSEVNSHKKARIQSPVASYMSSSSNRQSSSSRYHSDSNSQKQTRISSSSSSSRKHAEADSRKHISRSSSCQKSSSRYRSETSSQKQSSSSDKSLSLSSHRSRSQTNSREQNQGKTQSLTTCKSLSRNHSESNSRAQTSLRSVQQESSSKRLYADQSDKKLLLFSDMLKSLKNFSDALYRQKYFAFNDLVKRMLDKIETCQSTIDSSDYQSLGSAESTITLIEKTLANRMNDEKHLAAPHKIEKQVEFAFNNTLDSIANLLKSFRAFKSQIDKAKQPRRTRWSSPKNVSSTEYKNVDIKPVINSNQHDKSMDDDQSSDASHSSLGDEVLMEVARDAYEKRHDRCK